MYNILEWYEKASPFDIEQGTNWYQDVHEHCVILAREYGITLEIAVAVVAALSPRNNWKYNLGDARKVIDHWHSGVDQDMCRIHTTNRCKALAFDILKSNDPGLLSGPKVKAFYDNILHVHASERVTIDTWAARVFADNMNYKHTITLSMYQQAECAYKQAAAYLGVHPLTVQAITWTTIRRFSRARVTGKQLSLPI